VSSVNRASPRNDKVVGYLERAHSDQVGFGNTRSDCTKRKDRVSSA
jgi:hypothetical protein